MILNRKPSARCNSLRSGKVTATLDDPNLISSAGLVPGDAAGPAGPACRTWSPPW